MRRLVLLSVVLGAFAAPAPAGAIVNGNPDGDRHPSVGGLVNATQFADGTWVYCSGTLIAPRVFLTAAHCGEEGEDVKVTFDTAHEDGDRTHRGTFRADPGYGQAQSDPHDIPSSCSTGRRGGSCRPRFPPPARLPASRPASASRWSATAPAR